MEQERDVAHEVLTSIRQIVKCISGHSKRLSRDVGLTVPQLMCLKAIGELEGRVDEVNVILVGKRVYISQATVSRIIERLVRAGLVHRERSTIDRRRVRLSLTHAGLEQYRALPTPLQEKFIERLDALPVTEREQILSTLRRVAELMGAADLDAAPLLVPGENLRGGPP